MLISFRSASVALAAISTVNAYQPCPILGAVFPPPTGLCEAPILQDALRNLTATLDTATKENQTSYGPLFGNLTSFSIGVFDASSAGLLFDYNHAASKTLQGSTGTTNVTQDSIYRIGSGSKLISVYLFLIEAGAKYWNHPVTEFVPQLEVAARQCSAAVDSVDCIDWDDITLGALASHLAGVPRDYSGFGELLYVLPEEGIDPIEAGFPDLPTSDYPPCGWNYTDACTEAEYLQDLSSEHPTFAPFTTPAYSNAGFELLEYALENITGRSFAEMLETDLFGKLNMQHSSYYEPTNLTSQSVIPYDLTTSGFDAELGNETPVGGYYSSVTDLSRMGQSILAATLLSPSAVREWMKPVTFTSAVNQGVGRPWEIWRVLNLTDHVFDLYTKEGDIFLYSSLFVLSPDYDVGFVVLAAGNDTTATVEYLADTVAATIFPALEETARSQAQSTFGGTYQSNATGLNTSITLSTQSGEPGLVVESWYSNGTDFLEALSIFYKDTVDVRLYPTGLVQHLANGTDRISFRASIEAADTAPDGGIFSSDCETWVTVDTLMYGEVGIDEFVFDVHDGMASSISPRAFRSTLQRAS